MPIYQAMVLSALSALSALWALGACTGGGDELFAEGELYGACFPNGTCNSGLTCVRGRQCLRLDAALEADASAADASSVDAGFICEVDIAIEPNEDLRDATATGIPGSNHFSMAGLAICPGDDSDTFRFDIVEAGTDVRADITFEVGSRPLILVLRNASGIVIRDGTAVDGFPNTLRAQIPTLPTGSFYVTVYSYGTEENNYNIEVSISPP